jgi:cytochrome c
MAFHHIIFRAGLLLAAGLPMTARAQGCPVKASDFTRSTVVGNELNEPMQMVIDKANKIYYIERVTGNLFIYDPVAKKSTKAGTVPTYMNGSGKGKSNSVGLIGLTLAPDFETSHKLYLNYSPDPKAGEKSMLRVSRFTLKGDQLDLASEEKIIDYGIIFQCCHNGGDLRFGPDGLLYISTGDNTGGGWDVPYTTSQNPKDDNGKILRVRPHATGPGYDVPEGNLFKNAADGNPEVYVMGVRNPYRIDVDPRTGWLYWGDVGPDGPRMEEFDQAREAGNYGYPAYYGDDIKSPTFSQFKPNALAPVKKPLLTYDASSDKGYTSATVSASNFNLRGSSGFGGPIYYYNGQSPSQHKFPPKYHGSYFIWDWHKHWFKTVFFNDEGYIKAVEEFPAFTGVNTIDMKFSPDGELYILEYGSTYRINNSNDGLFKVTYNPPDPATCLPRAPELDTKTIGNAHPVGIAARAQSGKWIQADFVRHIDGRAFVDAHGAASAEAVILSLDGREISRVSLQGRAPTPLAPVPAGLYFVRLITPAGNWVQKTLL